MSHPPSPLLIPNPLMREIPEIRLTAPAIQDEKEAPSVPRSNPVSQLEEIAGEPREWSEQEEYLLALWSDRALCYKLMTERASRKYSNENLYFAVPIIILSTLCGSANLAVQSYVPPAHQSVASMVIGVVNLVAGVISTLQSFFRSAEKSAEHRNASVSWGKLHRLIFTELSLERSKRKPVKDFVRQAKNEYDRILDQSPPIPSPILHQFVEDIKRHPKLLLPEECGNLLHTASWEHVREQRIGFLDWKETRFFPEVMTDTP